MRSLTQPPPNSLRARCALVNAHACVDREAAERLEPAAFGQNRTRRSARSAAYRRRERPSSKKRGAYMAWIDKVLEDDRAVHKKQRHTAHLPHFVSAIDTRMAFGMSLGIPSPLKISMKLQRLENSSKSVEILSRSLR